MSIYKIYFLLYSPVNIYLYITTTTTIKTTITTIKTTITTITLTQQEEETSLENTSDVEPVT